MMNHPVQSPAPAISITRRLAAEALGTALLIIAVVGSGIMATRLSPNDVGLQLFENAAATAGALIGLILGIAGRPKAKAAGSGVGLATAAIVIGAGSS